MNAFKRNLILGYGISLVLLVAAASASYISIRGLLDSARWVDHTQQVYRSLENVISTLKDAETGQRGFLLTGDEQFLEPYNGAYDRANRHLEEVRSLTKDNPQQQVTLDSLGNVMHLRLNMLSRLIDIKRSGRPVPDSMLVEGKKNMDVARRLISQMEAREQVSLDQRTAKLNDFARLTPVFILVASLLSILVTLISFGKVLSDFKKRAALQAELEQKDRDIQKRLAVIEGLAGSIASGQYDVRVDDEASDALGSISGSLNQMAASLDLNFRQLSEKEWLQTGVARLNDKMIVEQDVATLADSTLRIVAEYADCMAGTLYIASEEGALLLRSVYGLPRAQVPERMLIGEGVAGEAVRSGRPKEFTDFDPKRYSLPALGGELLPKSVIAVPLLLGRRVLGVLELATTKPFTERTTAYFTTIGTNMAIAFNTAHSRERVQELLNETQAQAEELQTQHQELENINAELEAQAEKLQASEEELKVQQEELMQANQELEERARLLEERNVLIAQRNRDIQQKAEELALSTRYKSEFLANMSHELRTPLNSILLLSRLLSENNEKNLSNDQVEYAQVIQSSGQGLLALIDEILDLSKIEAGKMELEFLPVAPAVLVHDLKGMFLPIANDKGLEFHVNVDASLPGQIETDKMRLEQVLKNLVSNALKFTEKGSVSLTLDSGAPGYIRFAVRDTGIGIAADKQALVFEAFRQADGSTRRKYGGTGLGLSISRELTRLLGGELRLESEAGKGSTFSFELPMTRQIAEAAAGPPAAAQPTRPEPPAPEVASAGPAEPAAANLAPQRHNTTGIPAPVPDDRDSVGPQDPVILIIEDDTAFARALLDFTRKRGYKGLVAVRGDEGIELARRFRPKGVLLDIQLPVKDGWEVMEALKQDPVTRPIPVHMMSSLEARRESRLKGAIDFISKPVAFDQMQEVFSRIEQVVNKENKKVLIVEENERHAQALAYFLETFNVSAQIAGSVPDSGVALQRSDVDCVILDMGVPDPQAYEMLESLKQQSGLESLPIIVFTGRSLSRNEEARIKQYADSIVVKTAHSYQRILDEVSLFLHLVEEQEGDKPKKQRRLGALSEVLAGRKILVADDDVRNIFSLSKALEPHGMEVLSATDGREALQQLGEHPDIDVVLMDIMMPEMDGYEAMQAIRKMPAHRNLPIIAVTAKAMSGDREKCIQAGASDYISKPVDVDQLLSLLRVWLYE
ncbi:response regulator [Flaviaesturariibacter terrae]